MSSGALRSRSPSVAARWRYRCRAVREIAIRGETIRLGQLLKLAGVIDSGAEVKGFLAGGPVRVNGEPEDRRGRQLHPGDVVMVRTAEIRIVARGASAG